MRILQVILLLLIPHVVTAKSTYFTIIYGGYEMKKVLTYTESEICYMTEKTQTGYHKHYGKLDNSRMACVVKMPKMVKSYNFCALAGVGIKTHKYFGECEVLQNGEDYVFKTEAWPKIEHEQRMPTVTCRFVCVSK